MLIMIISLVISFSHSQRTVNVNFKCMKFLNVYFSNLFENSGLLTVLMNFFELHVCALGLFTHPACNLPHNHTCSTNNYIPSFRLHSVASFSDKWQVKLIDRCFAWIQAKENFFTNINLWSRLVSAPVSQDCAYQQHQTRNEWAIA